MITRGGMSKQTLKQVVVTLVTLTCLVMGPFLYFLVAAMIATRDAVVSNHLLDVAGWWLVVGVLLGIKASLFQEKVAEMELAEGEERRRAELEYKW